MNIGFIPFLLFHPRIMYEEFIFPYFPTNSINWIYLLSMRTRCKENIEVEWRKFFLFRVFWDLKRFLERFSETDSLPSSV